MKHIIKTRSGDPALLALATSIARGETPVDAEIIYEGRNRLYRTHLHGKPVIVKAFRRPNAVNTVAYTTVRRSKAARSYANALRLESLGLATPRPLAYMEVRRGLCLRESYYICEDVAAPQIRRWERRPDAEALLAAFGRDIARLHRAGVLHKDFSPGNVLVGRTPAGGYIFYYIDLNRMQFGVHDARRLVGSFGRMHHREEGVRQLARHYAEALRQLKAEGEEVPDIEPERVEPCAVEAFRRFWRHRAPEPD